MADRVRFASFPSFTCRFRVLRPTARLVLGAAFALLTAATLTAPAAAQLGGPGGLGGLDDLKSDILADLEGNTAAKDLEGLRHSHLTLVATWAGVEPLNAREKVAGETYAWKSARGHVSPLGDQPISTLVAVPQDGEYRIFLRHWVGQQHNHPIALSLTPEAGGPAKTHRFGEKRLLANTLGKEQEKRLPLRFESEVALATFPDAAMFAWEYWDVKLKRGAHRLSLQSDRPPARVHSVFLSRSKTFRPSFSEVKKDNTLDTIFVRYRVLSGATAPQFSLNTGLTYHWRGRNLPGSTEPMWGDGIGSVAKVPAKEWSPFIDAREPITLSPGPYATCRTTFQGVADGRVEVQFAWHPHEAAVGHSFQTAVGDQRLMFRIPSGAFHFRKPATSGSWGVWDPARLADMLPEETIVEKYFAWAQEAADTLGVPADHPKPKLIHVLSSCRTGAAHRPRAAEMLAKLGVNWIPDAPADVARKYDLYDDRDAKKIKIGDEITTYTPAAVINADAAMRAGFRDFLRRQAGHEGVELREFLGVDDLQHVDCLDRLPENAGRFERRLFFCSQRYCHLATIDGYARLVKAIEKKTPRAQIYNNYSPHPLFLTGRDMNHSDWFLLPRAGAQTLGWAEDWATGGGWGLGTPMTECTTFYASLVDCSVRKRGYPAGFYVGSNCGYSAQKMFSCVSQGISILHLYDWGPIDAWAEGSNAWSEMQGQYLSVMQGTHALGPVDEIVARGKREPRRTALLYNRSHEIVSGQRVWLNRDWMWTFLALRNSQIPVDVVIEDDLNATDLAQYEVIYAGGLNLERRHLQALRAWVEQGGVLIGSAGFAQHDPYGDRMSETVEMFGARQRLAGPRDAASRAKIQFAGAEEFPDVALTAASAGDQKYVLTPTTGRPAAAYDGGETAAVVHSVGRGKAILLGVTAGELYRANGGATSAARNWLVAPAVRKLGRPRAEYDCPQSEVTLFEHASGVAVLIAIYASKPDELSTAPGRLSVQTDREVREVTSALHGPLKWERRDGRIEIETPPASKLVVDSITLR